MNGKLGRILLIDDDNPTNFLNSMVVEESGCAKEIVIKVDGREALDYLTTKTGQGYPQPEITFLDINMPVMDGWEFLEEYESLPDERKGKLVVVMLSVPLTSHDKKRMDQLKSVGEFIDKPLATEHIHTLLKKHFSMELDM